MKLINNRRAPTLQEEKLLEFLIETSRTSFSKDWKNELLVCPMDDGAMGSLYLFPKGILNKDRVSGKLVSDFKFTDRDGIEVIASLFIDKDGNLLELDIWKTNFDRLISLPNL